MTSLKALGDYASDGSGEEGREDEGQEEVPTSSRLMAMVSAKVNPAPLVVAKTERKGSFKVDPSTKELAYNPKYEELFAPVPGPENPFKSKNQKAQKNTLTGFVEPANFNHFQFAKERQTFETYGYAMDPSADAATAKAFVGRNVEGALKEGDYSVMESGKKTGGEKRKRERNMDPGDMEGYTGPWGKYVDEETVSKPDETLQKEMDTFTAKRRARSRRYRKEVKEEAAVADEKTTLHVPKDEDYLGRSFLVPPQDQGVNLRPDFCPDKCFVPKKQLHTYTGHNKGINAVRWFPGSAHLFLSGSMDSKIKIWEVYKKRRCVRTYAGHSMAIKDVQFNNDGTNFLSASFDRHIKLWDTETGQVVQRFNTGKIPFCLVYNPDADKQHMFLAGMQDKKICQWDLRSGEMVQEYDRHLGPVNSITFFDGNRRFVSTSDDKSLRIWEWEIPVDTKLIQDPSLHSLPSITKSPNGKWLVGNSMDNRLMLFQVQEEKLRFAKKKSFRGHGTAGYSISSDFSPDMSYITSGDSGGRVCIWDWKNHRMVAKWKAHDNCCNAVLWHPHETSKVLSAGWDGLLKLWA